MALLYNLALAVLSPLLVLFLGYRMLVLGKSREGLAERFGWMPRLPPPGTGGRVWLHAVSAGEMVAAAAVARSLHSLSPETEVVLSSITPAGREQGLRLVPFARVVVYFPFDLLPCVWMAYRRLRPSVVGCVETEIWPNWLWWGRRSGTPSALVNGLFANKGYARARRAPWLYRWALGQMQALYMQTSLGVARALELGAPSERLRLVGNVKFDQSVPDPNPELAAGVRRALGAGPLVVAASTHPGEEEVVLEALARLREADPAPGLLLVPRHTQRAQELLELAASRGLRVDLRSRLGRNGALDVLILDTMGELAGLYALGTVAFVGGSLVPIGGHDIIQPLMAGVPTVVGPHMHNQQDVLQIALEGEAVIQVGDATGLAEALARLLADPALRRRMAARGREVVQANQGAAQTCAEMLLGLARSAVGRSSP